MPDKMYQITRKVSFTVHDAHHLKFERRLVKMDVKEPRRQKSEGLDYWQ